MDPTSKILLVSAIADIYLLAQYVIVRFRLSRHRSTSCPCPDVASALTIASASRSRQIATLTLSVLVFAVQRADCDRAGCADRIDPAYGDALRTVRAQGVEVLAYRAEVAPAGIRLVRPLPVIR